MVYEGPIFVFSRHPTEQVLVPVDEFFEITDVISLKIVDAVVQSKPERLLKIGFELSVVRVIQEVPEFLYNVRGSWPVGANLVLPGLGCMNTYREVCMVECDHVVVDMFHQYGHRSGL